MPEPGQGQAVLRVERFALSTNNITYARMGDSAGYWRCYPVPDGWGVVPAWGFARVTASRSAALSPGQGVTGLLPMASHVVLTPGRVSTGGFTEDAAHRRELARLYNVYRFADGDGESDLAMLLRPVFWLSFLLDDFLAANESFGAGLVVLTSASSKSALGTAWLLRRRGIRVAGLTSAAHRDAVARHDCYDIVATYDAIGMLPQEPAVLADLTGSPAIWEAVRGHLGASLHRSLLAGTTHEASMQDPAGEMFSVPSYIQARARDLGMAALSAGFETTLGEFAAWWATGVELSRAAGLAATMDAYRQVLSGESGGFICSL